MKIIIAITIISVNLAVKLPPNFQKCNRKQPDLKECILKAAQHGATQLTRPYRELSVPNVNPFELSEASVPGGEGPVAVSQKFTNCKIYGLPQMKLDKFEFDFTKNVLDVSGTFPEIRKQCNYEMKGRILVIPINGVGDSTITLKNLKITALLNYEETKKRNKTYIKFLSSKLTMDPELVTFNFLNRVDRRLSDNINPVLNENWKEIFDDVKDSYTEIINQIVLSLLNNFFSKLSLEEALDD